MMGTWGVSASLLYIPEVYTFGQAVNIIGCLGICAFLMKFNSFDRSSEADMAEGVDPHARGCRTDAQTCQDWNAKVGNQDWDWRSMKSGCRQV